MLRGSQTPTDSKNSLQDLETEAHPARLFVISNWQDTTAIAPEDAALGVSSEEKIEEEVEMSEDEYGPESWIV